MLHAFNHSRLNPTIDIFPSLYFDQFSSYQMYCLFDNPHANPFEIVCVAYATVNNPFQFVSKNARLHSTTLWPISHMHTSSFATNAVAHRIRIRLSLPCSYTSRAILDPVFKNGLIFLQDHLTIPRLPCRLGLLAT